MAVRQHHRLNGAEVDAETRGVVFDGVIDRAGVEQQHVLASAGGGAEHQRQAVVGTAQRGAGDATHALAHQRRPFAGDERRCAGQRIRDVVHQHLDLEPIDLGQQRHDTPRACAFQRATCGALKTARGFARALAGYSPIRDAGWGKGPDKEGISTADERRCTQIKSVLASIGRVPCFLSAFICVLVESRVRPNLGSGGEPEHLHLIGVLSFDDEFREDVGCGGIQEEFRHALAQGIGHDQLRGRDAGPDGAQPGAESVPDALREGDGQVLKQSLTDDSRLDEDVEPRPSKRKLPFRRGNLRLISRTSSSGLPQSLARRQTRPQLLATTEVDLRKVVKAVARKTKPLRGADKIGLAAGAMLNRHKACPRALDPGVAKHFILTITDDTFGFERNTEAIDAEGRLDGFYVIRTNLDKTTLATSDVVRVYKSLSQAERAFRSIKTVEIRPIHHRLSDRVRAHVLLCMLAYYLEWHMRQVLAPILFDDHQRAEAAAARSSIVVPAQRSGAARRKAATKHTADGLPVHSFQSLLAELATFTRNTMAMAAAPHDTFLLYPQPTPTQLRAFELLAVQPRL